MISVPEINEAAALERVMSLMAIPGRSRQELGVVQHVIDQLRAAGVGETCITIDRANRASEGNTGNLIVKLPGTLRKPRRLLMAHLDTVPICVGCKPMRDGDVIRSADPTTGLGADDRAGVSTVLTAALELIQRGVPHPPLTLFFAVQEEIGLCGARHVSVAKLGRPALCFNWDGGDASTICIGATGDYAIEVDITGIPSHAGVHPERGVSAIAIASRAIEQLVADGWHGKIEQGRKQGTSNVGVIQGGEATNVVTPRVQIRAEARSHDPVFRKKIVDAYRKAFEQAAKSITSSTGQRGSVTFQADLKYEAFCLDRSEPVVTLAEQAVTAVGRTPLVSISNGGLDANWMASHGFPAVTLGCGQQDIHTTKETLNIADYLTACRTAVLLASGQLG